MKASPLTFLSLKFLRVRVEADFEAQPSPDAYDFDGAMLAWTLNHGRELDGRWWVAVGFACDQAATPSERRSPYAIDVQAIGFFRVADSIEADRREALVCENGAALVYGAIREMVASITARSVPGALMLPTPSFIGTFKDGQFGAPVGDVASGSAEEP